MLQNQLNIGHIYTKNIRRRVLLALHTKTRAHRSQNLSQIYPKNFPDIILIQTELIS